MPELSDILVTPSDAELRADLLSGFAKKENPVSDWIDGAAMRTMYELECEITFELVAEAMPIMAAGAFTDTSEDDWLTLLAHHWYDRDREQAAAPIQTVTLARVAGTGSDPIVAGRTVLLATDDRRYIATSGGTLAGGGTLSFDVQGEGPGAGRGLINRLEVPLAGVSVTAAIFKIITSVTQFGSDEESDASLAARCDARWPDLETVVDEDRVVRWAKAAAPDDVTRVRLDADTVNPGGVLVTLAGAGGGVAGGIVVTVQAYIDARQAITDLNTAQSASTLTVDVTGSVKYPAAWGADELQAAQDAADAAWTTYLSETTIGGKVRLTELEQAIMDTGAIDNTTAITGAGGDGNLALATDEVPVVGTLPSALTWEAL